MFGRALIGVLLALSCVLVWDAGRAMAQDPESASAAGPACEAQSRDCAAGPRAEPAARVIPSAQGELADGHADPSTAILIAFALASFAGLVVSVLNRLAQDETTAP